MGKVLKFEVTDRIEVSRAATFKHPAITLGQDGVFRIAADTADLKEIWAGKVFSSDHVVFNCAFSASLKGEPNTARASRCYRPRVAGDVVVARCGTKGLEGVKDTQYGPGLTVLREDGKPGAFQFFGFCTGAAEVACSERSDYLAIFSKDGAVIHGMVSDGKFVKVSDARINIGSTGEKIAFLRFGSDTWWAAMGGCASKDDSQVASNKFPRQTWLDCDTYTRAGDDVMGYVGLGVSPKNWMAYLAVCLYGKCLVNKVSAGGRVMFAPDNLSSIGAADEMDRHAVQFIPAKGRMAALWSRGGGIVFADVDAVLSGGGISPVLCPGSLAAACPTPDGFAALVVKDGGLVLYKVRITKA
jgi:hypothetical protein